MNQYKSFPTKALLVCLFLVGLQASFSQTLSTTNIAGNGTGVFEEDNLALETGFNVPGAIAYDSFGNIYFTVASIGGSSSGIYKIERETKKLEKVLGSVMGISGIAIDSSDDIYFCRLVGNDEGDNSAELIFKFNQLTGIVDTIAGNGLDGLSADGVDARSTPIGSAGGIKLDPSGEFLYYLAALTGENYIQKINLSTGTTHRVAGISGLTPADDVEDGTLAAEAELSVGLGLAFDSFGNIYFNTKKHTIKKISIDDNRIYNVAGTGEDGYNGDNIEAATAQIATVNAGMTIDENDVLYFCDSDNFRIRTIDLFPDSGEPLINSIVGTGFEEGDGENPDGDLENGLFKAPLETNIAPLDVATLDGEVYFTDTGKNRIRKVFSCQPSNIDFIEYLPSEICNGDTATIYVSGTLSAGSYWAWYQDECNIGSTPISVNKTFDTVINDATTFYVAAIGGCASMDDCEPIEIDITCKEFYNAFSPNGDGVNEFLEIPALNNYATNIVIIYNRWGQEVTRIQDYDNTSTYWAGTYSSSGEGDVVDSGTYYFTAESNGELITSGWVQLVK